MIEQLSAFIIHLIQTSGYIGIFILMTLESALIPIPSEVTMPFSGFLVSKGELSLILVILAGAFGNLAGSLLAYAAGYYLEDALILGLVRKYGKFLLLTEHDYKKSIEWFNKYGGGISFFSRMLPAVRTFISLPAGMAKMNLLKFSIYTFFGSLIWSAFLTYIGLYLGNNWNSLEVYYRKLELLIAAFIIFCILFYINHKLKIVKIRS
ncbi:MAG: DedA family protein [Candidatus Levybacteria bacterium]|nr:DedA family protein [Candidatus Levybacteria bacterium]